MQHNVYFNKKLQLLQQYQLCIIIIIIYTIVAACNKYISMTDDF